MRALGGKTLPWRGWVRRAGVALVVSWLALPVWAQQGQAQESTLAKLSASGSITLGVRQDAAPFSYIDAAGKPAGFTWALCQAIVQQLSAQLKQPLAVKYRPVTLTESFSLLRAGQIDLHCGATAHTAARAQQVAFSDTYFVSQVVAAYRAGDAKFASAREFGRTGVLQGSTAQQLMQSYAGKKADAYALGDITPVASYAEGVKLLKSGTIDTLVADELMIPKDAGVAIRRAPLTLEPYALVMRKGDAPFAAAVDQALRQVLSSPLGQQLADQARLKVQGMTREVWRTPSKDPAPPQL